MGAQFVRDGEALGSLLVAETRRGELALVGRGSQGDEGCIAGHVASELTKLARGGAEKLVHRRFMFTANSSQLTVAWVLGWPKDNGPNRLGNIYGPYPYPSFWCSRGDIRFGVSRCGLAAAVVGGGGAR